MSLYCSIAMPALLFLIDSLLVSLTCIPVLSYLLHVYVCRCLLYSSALSFITSVFPLGFTRSRIQPLVRMIEYENSFSISGLKPLNT